MGDPVIVESVWSSTAADVMVAHLRSEGIEAFAKANLDTSRFGTGGGGAHVFVAAEDAAEARAILDARPAGDDFAPIDGAPRRLAWPRRVAQIGLVATVVAVVIGAVSNL